MVKFGGNEFVGFSVPLIFNGRYFLIEPGNPPKITVVIEMDGKPIFEVLKNEPINNEVTDVSKTPPGIITVAEKTSGKFLYKIRPSSETSVVFGKIGGGELSAIITDKKIQVGGITLENNTLVGNMAGVIIKLDGGVGIGAIIPSNVLSWFS